MFERPSATIRAAVSLAIGTSLAPIELRAEEPTQQMPRITVQEAELTVLREPTSPKLTAPLLDLPQTFAVIPNELFNQQGAQTLTDVMRNVPGISFNAGENGFSSGLGNFSIRGFDSSGSLFIDGARDSGNYMRDVFNLEQVEVAKGPAADNGRGGAGGYINMVTKSPRQETLRDFSLSYGFDDGNADEQVRGTFDINQPIGDRTAVRVNALWQDGGVPGREVAEKSSWGIAPSVAFGLGTGTRVVLAYQHVDQEDIPDWGVPAALIDGMMRRDPALDADSLRENFYGLASDHDDVTTDSVLGRIEYDFSPRTTLSNQLRWAETSRDAIYTMPFSYDATAQTVVTQRQAFARDNENLSNFTNLGTEFATGSVQHRAAFGLELTREKSSAQRFPTQNNPGTGAPISLFDPDSRRAGAWGISATETSRVEIGTVAAYAYDTLQFSERWQMSAGLRVEHYEVSIDSLDAAGEPISPDYDVSETTVGGKLGLIYKPLENGTLYASVAIAALPPGSFLSNPDISREGDNAFPGWSTGLNSPDAKVQRATNYEIGAKWDLFDRRLMTSVAAFRTERDNVGISGRDPDVTPLPPVALLGYGQQIVQGIELGISGQVNEAWTIFGGAVFLDSERRHSAELDEARRLANPGDYGAVLRTSGDELAFTPETTANLWTTYRFPFGLSVGGGVRYVGSSWVGRPDDAERIIPNGAAGELPSYTVVDALVSYDFTPAFGLRLNVQNLTDELYAVSTNWAAQRVLLGPSRSFLLSADIRF